MHISIYICSIHTHIDDTVSRLPTSPMVWNPHIHTFTHSIAIQHTTLDSTTPHYIIVQYIADIHATSSYRRTNMHAYIH